MSDAPGIRSFQSEADYNSIAEILMASESADQHAVSVSGAEIKDALSHSPRFDLQHDLVIIEMNGTGVGYGRVSWAEEPLQRVFKLNGFIRPEWRGQGLGNSLLSWLEARAKRINKAQPALMDSVCRVNATQYQAGLHALAREAGYRIKESWVLMVRPNLEGIPDATLPDGLEARPVSPGQLSDIWYAVEEAYVPDGGPAPRGVIPEDFKNDPNFQPELWQVAWDVATNKVVGSVLTYINQAENKQLGILRGYTEGISTIPAWRRRGVATALIARSLKAQRQAGMIESALICSGEKPDNYRLYESCGFKEVKRDTVYEKPLQFTR